jgi:glucan phosphoethanolaminetransferase (alkaline phosphatase superfamily)
MARITGGIYLLYFLTAISGESFIRGIIVSRDPAATATNILAHERLFRLSVAVGLIATALYIAVTVLFYGLFKPVNKTVALLAAFFSLVGCAIQAFGSLFRVAPLAVLEGSPYLNVFKVDQLQAVALMSIKLNAQAAYVSLVFFGLFNLLIGYLIFKSTFLPRILGALMALSGLGWLTFLSPSLANYLFTYIEVLGIIAEASLMLWLLVKGVNIQRWKEQASAARSSG